MTETINAVTVAAAKLMYVFKTARCCSLPSRRTELKLGQKIQRKIEPTIANISDVYEGPSIGPASFSPGLGRNAKLTANPKYAPNE